MREGRDGATPRGSDLLTWIEQTRNSNTMFHGRRLLSSTISGSFKQKRSPRVCIRPTKKARKWLLPSLQVRG